MTVFTPEELEPEILCDLREEIFELYESSLQNLVELQRKPDDKEMQRALFRSIHTIKGDLGLVGFLPMIEVLQYLEDVLDMLRKGEIEYSNWLHDLVVHLLDKVTTFVDDCVNTGKTRYNKSTVDAIAQIIKRLSSDNPKEHEHILRQAINALNLQNVSPEIPELNEIIEKADLDIPTNFSSEKDRDLEYFKALIRPVEKHCGLSEGRAEKIANLALYINSLHETPIDEAQLTAACYIQDFGMAFVPAETIRKAPSFSDTDIQLLRTHAQMSARLIEHSTIWDEARNIVLQHHERVDGSGYPNGLVHEQISEGAKLLAIVETYIDTITPNKLYAHAKSEIDAVIAINKDFKGKFSNRWLRLFNQGITQQINAK